MRSVLVALNIAMGLIALGAGFLNLRRGIATESKQALRLACLAPYLALAAFAMALAAFAMALAAFAMAIVVAKYYPP
jgi:hypothetical protein